MAEVRVLLDPGDDMQVSVGLLDSHDPARGRVVVHPTPGTSSPPARRPSPTMCWARWAGQ